MSAFGSSSVEEENPKFLNELFLLALLPRPPELTQIYPHDLEKASAILCHYMWWHIACMVVALYKKKKNNNFYIQRDQLWLAAEFNPSFGYNCTL